MGSMLFVETLKYLKAHYEKNIIYSSMVKLVKLALPSFEV